MAAKQKVAPQLSPEERRLKKQLRREKQRAANIGRAQKMHALRLSNEVQNQSAKPAPPKSVSRTDFHIGCSGWFYWHLRDTFYRSLPTTKWFEEYARHFKTVEINASFYSWPTEANIKSWIKQAGRKQFIYTVKVCELITHIKQFKRTKELVKDFGVIADLLGSRMGCFLFQLPPSFKYTPARLKRILAQLEPERRNVVEFRHASWWRSNVYEAFQKAGAIFCSCSGPKLPDTLVKTADDIYIRFHGVDRWYRYDYSKAELNEWARRIATSGARRAWIYFNNDNDGYAVKNAAELSTALTMLKKPRSTQKRRRRNSVKAEELRLK